MAQIVTQSLVLGFELAQAQSILARLGQQLLGGGIGAAVREFGWLGYRHLTAGQNELYRGTRSRLSQVAFRLPNRKMDESYQREAKHSDPSDETEIDRTLKSAIACQSKEAAETAAASPDARSHNGR